MHGPEEGLVLAGACVDLGRGLCSDLEQVAVRQRPWVEEEVELLPMCPEEDAVGDGGLHTEVMNS